MGWTKREASANLVILGDAEGHTRRVAGLLASVVPDPRYPDNRRYELVQQDGSSKVVAGSASINSQLGIGDVGKFVKLSFTGWERGRNGHYKVITVEVYEGEPSAPMQNWPRFAELRQPHAKPRPEQNLAFRGPDPEPEAPDDDDDELPF